MCACMCATFIVFWADDNQAVTEFQAKITTSIGSLTVDAATHNIPNFAIEGNATGILLVTAFHGTCKRSNIFGQMCGDGSPGSIGGFPPVE